MSSKNFKTGIGLIGSERKMENIDYINDWKRDIILDSCIPLLELYSENIDKNLRLDNIDGAKMWINQIESIMNVIDGKNDK